MSSAIKSLGKKQLELKRKKIRLEGKQDKPLKFSMDSNRESDNEYMLKNSMELGGIRNVYQMSKKEMQLELARLSLNPVFIRKLKGLMYSTEKMEEKDAIKRII